MSSVHAANLLLHLEDRNIKCASTQVVNGNDRVIRTVESIRQSGSSGLVDHMEHIEASDPTGILSDLTWTLSVIEVSRDSGDDMPTLEVSAI